jgi:anti-sigma regulatory factor (Ser/Thr protein kinase)
MREWLTLVDLTDDARDDLVSAVDGAASNAFEHAYLAAAVDDVLDVTFWTERHRVWMEVVDHGRWRNPSVPPRYRGCGIAMMERLVDTVLIHYDSRGTSVLLGQRRAGRTRGLSNGCGRRLPLHGWDTVHPGYGVTLEA